MERDYAIYKQILLLCLPGEIHLVLLLGTLFFIFK